MNQKVSWLASICLVLFYLAFSLIAFWNFPGSFSPLSNWLSDLGSKEFNPNGAVFYNIGIVLGGASSVAFFLGFSTWKMKGKKIQNIMVLLAQVFGILGGISMILSAIFPITAKEIHSFLSASLYIFFGTAFAFVVFALRYYAKFPRWLLALGILTVVVNFVWSVILNIYPLEWATVGLFLLFILLIGMATRNKTKYLDQQTNLEGGS